VALNLRDAQQLAEARARASASGPSATRDDALLALERAVLHDDFTGAGALLSPHAQQLALAIDGDEARGRTYAARFYEAVLDAQRTQDTLDALLRARPTDRDTSLTCARVAITIGNDGYTAAQRLDALIDAGGEATPQVLGWRGRARALTNQSAEAIVDLDAALASEMTDARERAELFAARAQAHTVAAKHMSAERDLTEAIACAPKRGSLRVRRAAVRATVLRPLDAAEDYTQALALAPLDCPDTTLADLAACLFNGRRYAQAEEAYARAARQLEGRASEADRLAMLLEQRGACLHCLGRFADAVEQYTRALAHKPAYGKAHSDRGEALLELGRDEAAFADLERAVAEGYKAGCTLVARGTYFQRKGEHAKAIAELDEAARVWPSSPVPFEARALSLEATGEARRAHDDREHASVLRATRRS
jgi:tetratricopeptide (TPR) repeat protein